MGFVNLGTASKRVLKTLGNDNPTNEEIFSKGLELGVNPCVEIILHSKNVCNLTTVNIKAFVIENKKGNTLDLDALIRAQQLSARMGLRMTLLDLELPEWNKIQQRDRLLGTSLTGWKDAMDMLDYSIEQENELKSILGKTSREEASKYASELRVNAPMFTTAIKPEGTLSQVMGGVSSGLHWSHSPNYLRRIRLNSSDPLALAVRELEGWNVYAEVGTNGKYSESELAQDEQLDIATTWVTEFPISSGAKRTKDDISIDEQFDNYFSFQDLYTDMNTSNTITVKPDEWKQAQKRVWDGWEDFVGVSFLSLDGGTYTLAPYQSTTEEALKELEDKMVLFDPEVLQKYEQSESSFDIVDEDCIGGVCPVR